MLNKFKNNEILKILIFKIAPKFIIHIILFVINKKYRCNNSFIKIDKFYVYWLAPKIANNFLWINWPIYLILKKFRCIFLINNIHNSVGHVTYELDWYLRLKALKLLPEEKRFIIIWPKSEISKFTEKYYKNLIDIFIVNDLLYALVLPILIRFPQITFDCGLSALDITQNKITEKNNKKPLFKIQIPERKYSEIWERVSYYYIIRNNSNHYYPMKINKKPNSKILDLIEGKFTKYAVIKINTNTGNATAEKTDPLTYISSILFLKNNGYEIIFAGREKMPEIYKNFGIINYAESPIANFGYDLELISNSSFVITTGSGFGLMADTMGISMVSCNSWHLTVPMPSRYCVTIPTLLHNRTGKLMKFSEQIDYFYELKESNTPPPREMKARNATSEEILYAVIESLELRKEFCEISNLQKKYKNIKLNSPLFFSESRISNNFIEKFKENF